MPSNRLQVRLFWAILGVVVGCMQPVEPPPLLPLPLVTAAATVENSAETTQNESQVFVQELIITPTLAAASAPAEQAVDSPTFTVSARAGVPSAWQAWVNPLPDFGPVSAGGTVELVVGQGETLGYAAYALVVPLYSLTESTTREALQTRWLSESPQLAGSTATLTAFSQLWGHSGAGVLPIDDRAALADRLWAQDDVWGIVPLDELSTEFRTLRIDGVSPLDRATNIADYALALPIGALGDPGAVAYLKAQWQPAPFDWRADRLTRVALTGVTALVRATAYFMEQNGILWPGEEVRDVLNSADIAHLSNEVAFVEGCPYPSYIDGTSFCSDVRYFELVKDLGIDVMELTGNHVNDYGATHLAASIDMYEAAGMRYFGGGRNSADATSPAIFEHNGNRIAFLGCNPVGPSYAWAGPDSAGSRPCDAEIKAQIGQLADEGAIVIMTLQYHEFYFYEPTYQQQIDFRAYIDAGATIVSGSQAHHVQGFDLYGDGFIHYGPGNLFFDQMDALGTRQAMIDHYLIYDGRLVGVEFTTGLIENYARPRLMSDAERQQLLQTLFNVSTR